MVTENDVKEYYNKRHLEDGAEAWRPACAFPVFLDFLGASESGKILDIGCGTGFLLAAAEARGLLPFGVDISEDAVALARKTAPTADILVAPGEALPFEDGRFDYLICLGALEHFIDMDKGLSEMIRVTRDQAKFCILVPNINFLYWKFKRRKGTEQQDIKERLLSLEEWKQVFTSAGFNIVSIHQDRWWFMNKDRVFGSPNPLHWLRIIVRKMKWMILPLGYTYQFVFILEKS